MTVRHWLAAAMLVALVACGGTSGSPDSETDQPTPQQSDQSEAPQHGGLEQDSPSPYPTWDAQRRDDATEAAETAMLAFARPNANQKAWWKRLGPLLTEDARQDYSYVDTAQIPVKKVTGPTEIVDDDSSYVAKVRVPTNIGDYAVVVTWKDGEWLVNELTPPTGAH